METVKREPASTIVKFVAIAATVVLGVWLLYIGLSLGISFDSVIVNPPTVDAGAD